MHWGEKWTVNIHNVTILSIFYMELMSINKSQQSE